MLAGVWGRADRSGRAWTPRSRREAARTQRARRCFFRQSKRCSRGVPSLFVLLVYCEAVHKTGETFIWKIGVKTAAF